MAYDADLADRIRALLSDQANITEKKMFGGLAFLTSGNMAIAASGEGGVMVRVDPTQTEKLLAKGGATPMEMKGRPMTGWLRVDDAHLGTKRQLSSWVDRGIAFAGSLPPKPKKKAKKT